MKIVLAAHDPEWKFRFEAERQHIAQALVPMVCTIEHIGSTAVEGLMAKPIIDIMIGLEDFGEADLILAPLAARGYIYVSEYESMFPDRRFLYAKDLRGLSFNIHAVAYVGEFWLRHLAFRDYLRQHPSVAKEYQALKLQLAQREWRDGNEYAAAKGEFIRSIEAKAK
jgi:GrpB-like predicted nucleotidyltransferase (UPF0157 family)